MIKWQKEGADKESEDNDKIAEDVPHQRLQTELLK